MKTYLILLFFLGFFIPTVYAQTIDASSLLQNAQSFLNDKQYENTIVELNKILDVDPDNVDALNKKGQIRLI